MTRPTNLDENIPAPLPDEVVTTLLRAVDVRIERIVSLGDASPDGFQDDQNQGEWVLVLKRAAQPQLDERKVELHPGDDVQIPAETLFQN